MEKRANEFLRLAGELYEEKKSKWRGLVVGFDEDVFNDTIIKVYESILRGADTQGDLKGYWFKSFKNNLRKHHIKMKLSDTIIKEKECNEDDVNLLFSTISIILYNVYKRFDRRTFEVFRMYLLCNMSYEQIDDVANVDSKEKISRVRKWLTNDCKDYR